MKTQSIWSANIKRLPVVGDAGVGIEGFADGKIVPVVIIDAVNAPEVQELIKMHQHVEDGDAIFAWGYPRGDNLEMHLLMRFLRPMEVEFGIKFDLRKDVLLVDAITTAGVLHIQCGQPGDRFIHNLDAPQIHADVSSIQDKPRWATIRDKIIVKRFRKFGLSKKAAQKAKDEYLKSILGLQDFRLG